MSVTVTDLGQRFNNGPWLFQHMNLCLRRGSTYALTGPSGAGKSTLLALLAGHEQPTEGTVHRDNTETVVWVFQNPFGVPQRSVLDHVMLPLLARGRSIASAQQESLLLLSRFHLDKLSTAIFAELSGGEAQRLMLARGIAAAPDLLLIDEPTAQLDMRTAKTIHRVIAELADHNATVVVATHDPYTKAACTETIDLRDFAAGLNKE